MAVRFALSSPLEVHGIEVAVVERSELHGATLGGAVIVQAHKKLHAVLVRGAFGRLALRPDGTTSSYEDVLGECGVRAP